eukprot:scaffold554431_cov17-Prasinocladus_malaysianus.AAC.1
MDGWMDDKKKQGLASDNDTRQYNKSRMMRPTTMSSSREATIVAVIVAAAALKPSGHSLDG